MTLLFREGTPDDARFWADVYTAAQPIRPIDPAEMQYLWEHPPRSRVFHRWIVRRDGTDVGVASIERPEWAQVTLRHTSIGGELLPAYREAATLRDLLSEVERRALAESPAIIRAAANEDDDLRAQVLRSMGYREDRRSRRWELDLVAERDRITAMTEASRDRMRERGIRVLTLDQDRDPEILRKLWSMSEAACRGAVRRFLGLARVPRDAPRSRLDRAARRRSRRHLRARIPGGAGHCGHRVDRDRAVGARPGRGAGAEVRNADAGDRVRRRPGADG